MSDNYCYTHMPEGTGYCVHCDVEAKGNRIAELEAENQRLKELIWNVAGWCYAEACMNLADGIDMREVAVPDFIDKLKKDIPEVAALKGADDVAV